MQYEYSRHTNVFRESDIYSNVCIQKTSIVRQMLKLKTDDALKIRVKNAMNGTKVPELCLLCVYVVKSYKAI